jgi:uncharacterized metal-binding protein
VSPTATTAKRPAAKATAPAKTATTTKSTGAAKSKTTATTTARATTKSKTTAAPAAEPPPLPALSCAACGVIACRNGDERHYPQFCLTAETEGDFTESVFALYGDEELGRIARVSAGIEGEFYGRYSRVEETIEFIERMGYTRIGIATCVGLLGETKIFTRILKAHGLDVYVAGCKVGAIDKGEIGVPAESRIGKGACHESMCNPIMQAKLLEAQRTEFNIVIGLCVGHDTLFIRHSAAPTTVMIVKDRVLGHNPVAALYTARTGYSRFKRELQR